MTDSVCSVEWLDGQKVHSIRNQLKEEDFQSAVDIYKALADTNRLKIVYVLLLADELCVCDVASVLEVSVATASHHLRFLRKKGLAKYRKTGKMIYYSLDDDHVKELVELVFIHRNEEK